MRAFIGKSGTPIDKSRECKPLDLSFIFYEVTLKLYIHHHTIMFSVNMTLYATAV